MEKTMTKNRRSFFVACTVFLSALCLAQQPSVITTVEAISVPIVRNGKNIGSTTIPKGSKLNVKGVKDDKIAIDFSGKTIIIPIEKLIMPVL